MIKKIRRYEWREENNWGKKCWENLWKFIDYLFFSCHVRYRRDKNDKKIWLYHFFKIYFHGYKINISSLMKPIEPNMNLRQKNRTEASFPYWHKSEFLGKEWSGMETRAQSKFCKIILEYFINSFPLLTYIQISLT